MAVAQVLTVLLLGLLHALHVAAQPDNKFLGAQALDDSALDDLQWMMRASESRRKELGALLRPIVDVLPNAHGSPKGEALLRPNSARYALHRVFSQRHGWQISGLEPMAKPVPAGNIVLDWFGAFLRRRRGIGLSMSDLVALAAMIEEYVHGEALDKAGLLNDLANQTLLSETLVAHAIVKSVTPGADEDAIATLVHAAEIVDTIVDMGVASQTWEDLKFFVWLRDVQLSTAYLQRELLNPFTPGLFRPGFVARVLDDVGDSHGRWQDMECQVMKGFLVELDSKEQGHVPLKDFYGAQLSGIVPPPFQLTESKAFLKALGVLDETDASRPGVMIPNYVLMRSNCVTATDVYQTCCIDECEKVLVHLERQVNAPTALPRDILSVVAKLSTKTVQAPGNLSASMRDRLEKIAKETNGYVHLHGRLFAQWLHFAFPYECAYPHSPSSDALLQTADAWLQEEVYKSEEDVQKAYAAELQAFNQTHAEMHLPRKHRMDALWQIEERLYAGQIRSRSRWTACVAAAAAVLLLAAAMRSLYLWAARALSHARSAVDSQCGSKLPKYLV